MPTTVVYYNGQSLKSVYLLKSRFSLLLYENIFTLFQALKVKYLLGNKQIPHKL